MIVKSSYFDQQCLLVLAEHLGSGGFSGPLYNASLALISSGFNPSAVTAWADLTEATFSGYSRATGVVWGSPILQNDGSYQILTALQTFQSAAASNYVANNIWGWALVTPGATPVVLLSEVFPSPVPLPLPNDGFALVLQLSEGITNPASYGNLIR